MYCILKYIEFHDFQKMISDEKSIAAGEPKCADVEKSRSRRASCVISQRTSISAASNLNRSIALSNVSSGNEVKTRQLYFNPNCFVQLILDYICEEIGIKADSDFDICNEEGDLLNIKDYEQLSSGTVMFTPRETYFVVLQARNSKGKIADVQVLLKRTSEEYFSVSTHLLTKIAKRTSSDKQGVTFKKRRGSKGSKESKTTFDFTHGFGLLKKQKSKTSKNLQHLDHK